MSRTLKRAGMLAMMFLGLAVPASAQIVHSVSFGIGFFQARGFDSRVAGDVLVADVTQPVIPGTDPPATGSLAFDFNRFNNWPVYGEWHMGFGDHIEVGVGAGFAISKAPSVYKDLLDSKGTSTPADDTEIFQELSLRTIPITGVVRVLAGKVGGLQPYGGGGVSIVNYRYSEVGDFVDTSDLSIFSARFIKTGTSVGGLVLGGLRIPLGGDVYALNVEGRYQWVVGKTGGLPDFLGDKIDLGGGTIGATFLIRF